MSVTINGSGQVIVQIVQGTNGTQASTTGSAYTSTGLTATITPTSSSNRILVLVNQSAYAVNPANGSVKLRLLRNSTPITTFVNNAGYAGNNTFVNFGGSCSTGFLDSPATTSAVTYSTEFGGNGTGTVYVQESNATSTITLMEISG